MIFKCIHVILGELVRPGDRVIMNADETAESWHYKTQQERDLQGRRGTVVGFDERTEYVSRYGDFGRRPGIYRARGRTLVQWDGDDGLTTAPDLHSVSWWPWKSGEEPQGDIVTLNVQIQQHNIRMSKERQALRPKDRQVEWEEAHEFVAELPEFPLYELDMVLAPDGQAVMVEAIDWRSMGDKCSDGTPFPVVRVRHLVRGYSTAYRPDELKFLEPGNVRFWFTGERHKMRFESESEELSFYDIIGQSVTVLSMEDAARVPQEAVEAIKQGRGDAIRLNTAAFTRARKVEVVRIKDRVIGERLRQRSMRNLGLAVAS